MVAAGTSQLMYNFISISLSLLIVRECVVLAFLLFVWLRQPLSAATVKYACHVLRWSLALRKLSVQVMCVCAVAVRELHIICMPMSRHFSRANPSASISATRCERRKFFIRFCFRKLFSTSFVRSIRFSFGFLVCLLDSWRSIWYMVDARALRIAEIVFRRYCRMNDVVHCIRQRRWF